MSPIALLKEALDLSKYAAAPFFSEKVRNRNDEREVVYIRPTTEEWWDGLGELIEAIQPKLEAAILSASANPPVAEPTLPVEVWGKFYEVQIPVHLRMVALEEAVRAERAQPHQDDDDRMYGALTDLVSLDTHDTNLRDHPKAYEILDRLMTHAYAEGRADQLAEAPHAIVIDEEHEFREWMKACSMSAEGSSMATARNAWFARALMAKPQAGTTK